MKRCRCTTTLDFAWTFFWKILEGKISWKPLRGEVGTNFCDSRLALKTNLKIQKIFAHVRSSSAEAQSLDCFKRSICDILRTYLQWTRWRWLRRAIPGLPTRRDASTSGKLGSPKRAIRVVVSRNVVCERSFENLDLETRNAMGPSETREYLVVLQIITLACMPFHFNIGNLHVLLLSWQIRQIGSAKDRTARTSRRRQYYAEFLQWISSSAKWIRAVIGGRSWPVCTRKTSSISARFL